ncbi:MAG: hypothetical protein WCL02_07540 [bacterium]
MNYGDNDIQAVTDARNQLLKTFEMYTWETKESEKTRKIHEEVRVKLLSNLQ